MIYRAITQSSVQNKQKELIDKHQIVTGWFKSKSNPCSALCLNCYLDLLISLKKEVKRKQNVEGEKQKQKKIGRQMSKQMVISEMKNTIQDENFDKQLRYKTKWDITESHETDEQVALLKTSLNLISHFP